MLRVYRGNSSGLARQIPWPKSTDIGARTSLVDKGGIYVNVYVCVSICVRTFTYIYI